MMKNCFFCGKNSGSHKRLVKLCKNCKDDDNVPFDWTKNIFGALLTGLVLFAWWLYSAMVMVPKASVVKISLHNCLVASSITTIIVFGILTIYDGIRNW